jgi:hypothetical protein
MRRLFHEKQTAKIVMTVPGDGLWRFRCTSVAATLAGLIRSTSSVEIWSATLPKCTRQTSASAFHENQLECFEMMVRSNVAVAVPAALNYCMENQLDAPPWLLAAATELLCDLLKREKSNKRGRSCGFVARHRQDMIDYARWDLVVEVRRKQDELAEAVRELREMQPLPKTVLKEQEKLLSWAGSTLDRAFECASMLLRGSAARGGPEAIKRSYRHVQRNHRNPSERMRYHNLDPRFLSSFGLKHETEARPNGKLKPVHELTL